MQVLRTFFLTMTTAKLLYDLQELDQQLDILSQRLSVISESLGDRNTLVVLEERVVESQESVRILQSEHRNMEMTADSTREKITSVETSLYDGSARQPRELQNLDLELGVLKRELVSLEDKIIESLETLDPIREELRERSESLKEDEVIWDNVQQELAHEKEDIQTSLNSLKKQRQQVGRKLGSLDLQLYERLRLTKGGQAVARMERGICRACSMALPTHQLQRVRVSREPVLCSSCGRILCGG